VRVCSRYFAHGAFLEDGGPIHGRNDLGSANMTDEADAAADRRITQPA